MNNNEIDKIKSIPLTEIFRKLRIQKKGKKYHCPLHIDKDPSLSINQQTNLFHCFSCGVGGSTIDALMYFAKLDKAQAIKELKESIYLTKEYTPAKIYTAKENKLNACKVDKEIYKEFINYIDKNVNNEKVVGAVKYLQNRGFSLVEINKYFHILTDYQKVNNHLKKTFDLQRLIKSGLFNEKGNLIFYNRPIILTIKDKDKNVIWLQGRTLTNDKPKYLNLRGISPKFMYSQFDFIQDKTIYLVEGIIDAISLKLSGYNSFAFISSTHLKNENWINYLKNKDITIFFDNDKAGQRGAEELHNILTDKQIKHDTRVLKGVKDFNELFILDRTQKCVKKSKKGQKDYKIRVDKFINNLIANNNENWILIKDFSNPVIVVRKVKQAIYKGVTLEINKDFTKFRYFNLDNFRINKKTTKKIKK